MGLKAECLRVLALVLVFALAFGVRMFTVLRYESVLHEHDPYFHFESVQHVLDHGLGHYMESFDSTSWYPFGRQIGGTTHPGIVAFTAGLYRLLHAVHIPLDLRDVCVFVGPFMAANMTLMAYVLVGRAWDRPAGVMSAFFMALAPALIGRTVPGNFDTDVFGGFLLLVLLWSLGKSLATASLFWSAFAAFTQFALAACWGGYPLTSNLIALSVLAQYVWGTFSAATYVAYSSYFVLSTALMLQLPNVEAALLSGAEYLIPFAVFVALQLGRAFRPAQARVYVGLLAAATVAAPVLGLVSWSQRSRALLDPLYSRENLPLFASQMEHHPATWVSFFFDVNVPLFFLPVGVYALAQGKDQTGAPSPLGTLLVVLTSITLAYGSFMVRLMWILCVSASIVGGIGCSEVLSRSFASFKSRTAPTAADHKKAGSAKKPTGAAPVPSGLLRKMAGIVCSCTILIGLMYYIVHGTWAASEAYSSPSVVIHAMGPQNSHVVYDDVREGYWWLRNNAPNARVLSWFDNGHQLHAMSNVTTITDNTVQNATHVALTAKLFASTSKEAYATLKALDVDYVAVRFGGMMGLEADDLNKFVWMSRIAKIADPSINPSAYLTKQGQFKVDKTAPKKLTNSLLYELSYYRFGEVTSVQNMPTGFDRVRGTEIGRKEIALDHFEEAFTSEHWLVRIYRVRRQSNRA